MPFLRKQETTNWPNLCCTRKPCSKAMGPSTILLASSNFGMVRRCFLSCVGDRHANSIDQQVLVAPTRKDIDRAHEQRRWLDIGVPSIGNLFRVSFHRTLLWFCLSLSSLPLHVFYNSAVYYQTAVPAYDIFVGPGSLSQMDLSDVHLINQTMNSGTGDSLKELFYAAKNGTLKHLDSAACVTAFGETYQTSYG